MSDVTDEEMTTEEYVRHKFTEDPEKFNPFAQGSPLGISRFQAATALTAALGEVLYALQMPSGLVKIGHTTHLGRRLAQLGPERVLAVKLGTRADELAIHKSLAAHVNHGQEWYNPTPEVLALVNEWRELLGREPVAA